MARALEIELGFDDPVAHVRAFGLAMPGAKPSMLLDLEAGRPTEVDFINGAIPRAGVGVGVAAPFNEAVSALVRALELGTLDSVLEELRVALGADRVTLRQDLPGDYAFPVTVEALGAGVGSLRDERTVDLRTQPVVTLLRRGEQVVQDDYAQRLRRSGLPPDARDLRRPGRADRDADLRATAGSTAIVSVHALGAPRALERRETRPRAAAAADRVRELL